MVWDEEKDDLLWREFLLFELENSISNSSNVGYYFRGCVKCVISYPSGIRSCIRPSTFLLNYWTSFNERSNNILCKENISPGILVNLAYLGFIVYTWRYSKKEKRFSVSFDLKHCWNLVLHLFCCCRCCCSNC